MLSTILSSMKFSPNFVHKLFGEIKLFTIHSYDNTTRVIFIQSIIVSSIWSTWKKISNDSLMLHQINDSVTCTHETRHQSHNRHGNVTTWKAKSCDLIMEHYPNIHCVRYWKCTIVFRFRVCLSSVLPILGFVIFTSTTTQIIHVLPSCTIKCYILVTSQEVIWWYCIPK